MTFGPTNTLGSFLPINQTFSEDDEQRLIQQTLRDRDIARNVNLREIAIYDTTEVPTGEQWFNNANAQVKRNGFRKVYSFGAFAAGTTATIPTGLAGVTIYTHIYGTAITTTPVGGSFVYVPLPYTSTSGPTFNIDLRVADTNIQIIFGAAGFSVSSGIVVLEFLKS